MTFAIRISYKCLKLINEDKKVTKFNSNTLISNNDNLKKIISKRLQDRRLWLQIEQKGLSRAVYYLSKGLGYLCWGGRVRARILSEVMGQYLGAFDYADEETLDFLIRCKNDYLRWFELAQKNGYVPQAVVDVLYFGTSLSDVDKKYQRRHGWALKNIIESLDYFRK